MALPDIFLNKGQVLLTQTESTSGLEGLDFLLAGLVAMQYSTSDFAISEWPVWFDANDAQTFVYDDVTYYLLDESKIKFRESSPL